MGGRIGFLRKGWKEFERHDSTIRTMFQKNERIRTVVDIEEGTDWQRIKLE